MKLLKNFFCVIFIFYGFNLNLLSQTYTYKITAINPVPNQYPGGRGPDELIIYDPSYPEKSTGTNQYGMEVTVQNGRITSIGGNSTIIPKDGFIISGHGKAGEWLANYSKIGAAIRISTNEIKMIIDLDCIGKDAQYRIDKVQRIYEESSNKMKNIDQEAIGKRITDLQYLTNQIDFYYFQKDSVNVIKELKKVDSITKEILFLSSESPLIEARGVWYRPVEKSKDEIIKTLEKLQKANFNILFLETIWNGETIYPGKITQQKQQFKHFDPLQIFIEEGQKRGIEIHAWIHTFFVGYTGKTDKYDIGPILKKHPDWAIKKRDGSKRSTTEDGYLYVCPAKPEVQNFLAQLYHEVVIKYPKLGGIQLDYIRYPENSSLQESYCYCDYCRNEFKKRFNADPVEISPDKDSSNWANWSNWREENINKFVSRIRKENDKILLSADIFPDTIISRETKMQNWLSWCRRGYLDIVAPMAYSTETKWLDKEIKKMKSILPKNQLIYCGIAPFLGLSPESLYEQIQTIRDNSIGGMIMFSLAYLSEEVLDLLKLGPFREKALLPHRFTEK